MNEWQGRKKLVWPRQVNMEPLPEARPQHLVSVSRHQPLFLLFMIVIESVLCYKIPNAEFSQQSGKIRDENTFVLEFLATVLDSTHSWGV